MKLDRVDQILTFHLSQIGDLLSTLPALLALRQRWPEARLTAVMRPHLAELVRNSPLVDETIWPSKVNVAGLAYLWRELRKRAPDLAVCFSQAPFLFLAARRCGARVRCGFDGAWLASTLTHRVPKTGPPSTANHLQLVESLGCDVHQRTYEGLVRPPEKAYADIDRRLTEASVTPDEMIVFAPGFSPRRSNKEWPRERFLELANRLTATGATSVLFVGTTPYLRPDDGASARLLDWSGTTSLLEAAALLERARLFVGLDSGMAHMAAAMGTPAVVLFGPTRPEETGPVCGPREFVVAPDRADPRCMETIEVDAVEAAVAALLERAGPA